MPKMRCFLDEDVCVNEGKKIQKPPDRIKKNSACATFQCNADFRFLVSAASCKTRSCLNNCRCMYGNVFMYFWRVFHEYCWRQPCLPHESCGNNSTEKKKILAIHPANWKC